MARRPRPRILLSPLLAPHGHLERFGLVARGWWLLFALYVIVRVAVADTTSTSGALATAVAATTATFFSSSLYHATVPTARSRP